MPDTLLGLSGTAIAPATWSDSTLLIIDAQGEYLDGRLPLDGFDEAVIEVVALLKQARSNGTPVIHIVQQSPRERGLFGVGTPGAEVIPAAKPVPGEDVIPKPLPNAFALTPLAQRLEEIRDATGRSKLLIAGFMTHMCISATARSALDHGFPATIIAAATATRDLLDPMGGVVPANVVQRTSLAELADRFAAILARPSDIDNGASSAA